MAAVDATSNLSTQRYISPQQPALAATVTSSGWHGHTVYVLGGLTCQAQGCVPYCPSRTVECYTYPSTVASCRTTRAAWDQYQMAVARVGHAAVYVATRPWDAAQYEVLALGGWGGVISECPCMDAGCSGFDTNYGTLKSVEPFTRRITCFDPKKCGNNLCVPPNCGPCAGAPPATICTPTYHIPDMSEPRCFFGAVCDTKNIDVVPGFKPPWWWNATIVTGGTQLPTVNEWGSSEPIRRDAVRPDTQPPVRRRGHRRARPCGGRRNSKGDPPPSPC